MSVRRNAAAVAATASLGLAAVAVPMLASPSGAEPGEPGFTRLSTYPVYLNVPIGVNPADPTVSEISAVSPDGNTVAYTDALGGRIGFLDISDPANPVGKGSHDVKGSGTDGPTSVSIVPSSAGDVALVVVDESTYPGLEGTPWEDEEPAPGVRAGRVDIVKLAGTHDKVASIDLGGQPDSIAISPDGSYAAIAIENQRNEAVTPDGLEEGDIPQSPAGYVQIIKLTDPDPNTWTATPVMLPEADLAEAGLDAPSDAEPEYVDINGGNQLALTLQENNGVVVIDLATATVETVWSTGNDQVSGIDDTDDGIFNPTGSIDVPREPDSIQWVGDGLVATANEGDWKGGSRGWTVFEAETGDVVWDAGSSFEKLAVKYGLFNNDRAGKKGAEPEGLAFDTIGGTPYAFVGSERSNFVAVYDMTDPAEPVFEQVLPATNGPEGLLPVPDRNLLVVSSEEDDAGALVRASVSIYRFGDAGPSFPTIESADEGGYPIGWGALGALSAKPGDPTHLYAASDIAYATGRIYSVDVTTSPAVIDGLIEVSDAADEKPNIDIEGVYARPDGGFWVAQEGSNGAGNKLLRLDAAGKIAETVSLPAEVTDHIKSWGLEGVSATGTGAGEKVYVAVQRPLWVDPSLANAALAEQEGHVARIGRYTPATGAWEWFGYPLATTSVTGDWIGLSEVTALDDDTLAVIERDKQNGRTAALKRVYTVDLPAPGVTGAAPITAPLTKTLAIDVLPALQARRGWTQEKLEGLTIGADGDAYAVTDNDGLDDASGETVFLDLGSAESIFGLTAPVPTVTATATATATATVTVTATPTTTPTTAPDDSEKIKKLKAKLKKAKQAGDKAKVKKMKKKIKALKNR